MRTETEIKARIAELEETSKIANDRLEKPNRYGSDAKELIYWEKAVLAAKEQIYGMRFSLGECE